MAWIITKDYLYEEEVKECLELGEAVWSKSSVGVQSKLWKAWNEAHPTAPRYAFKMYDDDGMLYYAGLCTSCDDNKAFDPLNDYGTPNAGAVRIDYFDKKTKKWEVL